ncbi:MAG TPA: hypothetical protein VK735_39945 [Pseudonocardia sp.]|uniref:hypothetical protein n=1 Tax=Pseudonocardia sp. TaxID=60912 RepID=UPI002C0437EB|nr:hypothetical protein [Pseudonocardia sp.]HTF53657.1 hypothetical protein [Pseudonocardia sp.]
MRVLLILLPGLAIAGLATILARAWIAATTNRLRRESQRLHMLLAEVDQLAYEHRDVSPELSYLITDTIRLRRKEIPQ